MFGDILFRTNIWLVLAITFGLLLLAAEAGIFLGRKRQATTGEKVQSQINSVTAAMMGLLALLLAFTFSMAGSRFDLRKKLVVEDANAIGTTSLRAQILPEPYRSEINGLLRRYVDNRIAYGQVGIDQDNLAAIKTEAAHIHKQLWAQAIAVTALDVRSVPAGLFVQSLNQTIDLHTARLAALENRVPDIILYLLIGSAILVMGMVGYGFGISDHRNLTHTIMVAILIALTIIVILDLDRPYRGLITVSQNSLIELRQSLDSYP